MADEGSNVEHVHFDSDEDALRFLKSKADDILQVGIPISGPLEVRHQGKTIGPIHGIGMIVFMVSGDIHLFRPSRAEVILNDGFLTRMRIRIALLEGQSE